MRELPETEGDLIALAANGDRDAQAAMVIACMAASEVAAIEATVGAEAFARLAAYNQNRTDDWLTLAGVLHIRAGQVQAMGDAVRAARLLDEVLGIFDHAEATASGDDLLCLGTTLSCLADEGDEDAAIRLNRLMEKLSPSDAAAVRSSAAEAAEAARELAGITRH